MLEQRIPNDRTGEIQMRLVDPNLLVTKPTMPVKADSRLQRPSLAAACLLRG